MQVAEPGDIYDLDAQNTDLKCIPSTKTFLYL